MEFGYLVLVAVLIGACFARRVSDYVGSTAEKPKALPPADDGEEEEPRV